MPWKIIASAFGWRPADDDDEGLLVVRHPTLRRRFSGPGAWKQAVLLSIRAPSALPALRKEGRP